MTELNLDSKFQQAFAKATEAEKTPNEFIEMWDKAMELAYEAALELADKRIRGQSEAYDEVVKGIDTLEKRAGVLDAKERSLKEYEEQLKIITEKMNNG